MLTRTVHPGGAQVCTRRGCCPVRAHCSAILVLKPPQGSFIRQLIQANARRYIIKVSMSKNCHVIYRKSLCGCFYFLFSDEMQFIFFQMMLQHNRHIDEPFQNSSELQL
jgi:hypothetical protein